MKKILIAFLISFSFTQCGQSEEVIIDRDRTVADAIFDLVNKYRSNNNLSPLEMENTCNEVAQIHSENMANGITSFGHDLFDERYETLDQALNLLGMGENVAYGQNSAEQVMESWINSPGHLANIVGDYTDLGVGVANDANGVPYYTQIFIKR